MSRFQDQIHVYKNNKFKELADHYSSLADGQSPHTFLITCADSRLCPQEISQTQAGEIFVIRNAGNLIPPHDANNPTNEGLTLEYGISVLKIPEIVVCGHAGCGAMGGLANLEKLVSLPIVHKALENYKKAHSKEIEGKDLDQLISWNVDNQLENLFSYPFVKEAMKAGNLKVYGMVYDFVNGEITYTSELTSDGSVSS